MSNYLPDFQEHVDQWGSEQAALQYLEACRPSWANGINPYGLVVKGTQLLTKDGRRVGNARVVNITPSDRGYVYTVRTDMENNMYLNRAEIDKMFHIGLFIV